MSKHRLQPLLKPSSIAVIGASQKMGSVGNEVFKNLKRGGFEGAIAGVNPSYNNVEGLDCYPTLQDIPFLPEHVIFAVSDRRLESALDEVIALGIPACTIFSSLIISGDTKPNLRQRIVEKVKAAKILMAGANCMGFYNIRDRVLAGGFDTRDHPYPGNVSLISQSGAGMSGIVDCEQRINFNFAVSTGYEVTVSMEDYLDYALELPETDVIGLFLETSRYPDKFIEGLKKASDRNVPIVVLKVGRTDLSAELAISHSGAMAGSDRCYDALFDAYGVQRVSDMDELATALIMFSHSRGMGKGGLVCLHDSGGERQLVIDLADQLGVPLVKLHESTKMDLEKILDPGLPAVNPLDGWGAGGTDAPAKMADCFKSLLADSDTALGAVVHDRGPNSQIYSQYLDYLSKAKAFVKKPVFLVANRQGSGWDKLAITSTQQGFPVIDGVSQFLVGVRCLMGFRNFKLRKSGKIASLNIDMIERWKTIFGNELEVSESLAVEFLADFGIPMVDSKLVTSTEELNFIGGDLKYPVAMKTANSSIKHKSDVGGVILDILGTSDLSNAYEDLAKKLGPRVVISPMISTKGVEMILGVGRDSQFGPTIVIGFGGIYAEVLDDVAILLPPFDAGTVKRKLQSLRMYPILLGARGEKPVDIDSYCEAASVLSLIAVEMDDRINEIDINPIKVTSSGSFGLDALVVLSSKH